MQYHKKYEKDFLHPSPGLMIQLKHGIKLFVLQIICMLFLQQVF